MTCLHTSKKWLKPAGIWRWFVVVAVSDWAALGNDFDWVFFFFSDRCASPLHFSFSANTSEWENHTNTFYSQLHMLPYFSVTPQPFISFWCLQRHSEKDVYIRTGNRLQNFKTISELLCLFTSSAKATDPLKLKRVKVFMKQSSHE